MNRIIEISANYCHQLLKNSRCENFPYHNLKHTKEVFENCKIIGSYEGLTEAQLEPVLIAALFHDTGITEVTKGHEELSALNAILFLNKQKYPEDKIGMVVNCINATKIPQNPITIFEKIICDADLSHLGRLDYFERCIKLKQEWNSLYGINFTDTEWNLMNIDFVERHTFQTEYGNTFLKPIKMANLEEMKLADSIFN